MQILPTAYGGPDTIVVGPLVVWFAVVAAPAAAGLDASAVLVAAVLAALFSIVLAASVAAAAVSVVSDDSAAILLVLSCWGGGVVNLDTFLNISVHSLETLGISLGASSLDGSFFEDCACRTGFFLGYSFARCPARPTVRTTPLHDNINVAPTIWDVIKIFPGQGDHEFYVQISFLLRKPHPPGRNLNNRPQMVLCDIHGHAVQSNPGLPGAHIFRL